MSHKKKDFMYDKKLTQGQFSLLLGIVAMLVWNSHAAIPFAFLCFATGICLILTTITQRLDLPNH